MLSKLNIANRPRAQILVTADDLTKDDRGRHRSMNGGGAEGVKMKEGRREALKHVQALSRRSPHEIQDPALPSPSLRSPH